MQASNSTASHGSMCCANNNTSNTTACDPQAACCTAPAGLVPTPPALSTRWGNWLLGAACTAWDYVDAGVAYIFGLDDSKFQWAVDKHNQQMAQIRERHDVESATS